MPLQKGTKTSVIRTPSVTIKDNIGKKVNTGKIEPNRPKKVQHKKPRTRPGRKVGIRSAVVLSMNPEEDLQAAVSPVDST